MAKETTRPPHSAIRYIETSGGIVSYLELAPLLAERVEDTEHLFSVKNKPAQGYNSSGHVPSGLSRPKFSGEERTKVLNIVRRQSLE